MDELAILELQEHGFIVMDASPDAQIIPHRQKQAADFHKWAMDAQPTLNFAASGAIPFYLANYVDPVYVEAVFTPMKAAIITGGDVKKGDWTTATVQITFTESTGSVNTYGDYNNDGQTGVNFNFNYLQPYHYQVMQSFGELEIEKASLARINIVSDKNIASTLTLNKFQNQSYFFGIAGLQNYGLLNFPNLPASITPIAPWSLSATDGVSIYNDVVRLVTQLVSQGNGVIEMDTPMTMAMSPTTQMQLTKTNQFFNKTVREMIRENFPNVTIETAPEYATAGTGGAQLIQLIANSIEGHRTAEPIYTEKMRAHRVVLETSSYKRKVSQGTAGTMVYRPFAIASMYGV